MTEERLGFIGIVLEDRKSVSAVNAILSSCADMISGRIGVPDHETGTAVIGLIIRGSNDRVGALTGRLGSLPGVHVKSAMTSSCGNTPRKGTEP